MTQRSIMRVVFCGVGRASTGNGASAGADTSKNSPCSTHVRNKPTSLEPALDNRVTLWRVRRYEAVVLGASTSSKFTSEYLSIVNEVGNLLSAALIYRTDSRME